jgi:hypothetical protein
MRHPNSALFFVLVLAAGIVGGSACTAEIAIDLDGAKAGVDGNDPDGNGGNGGGNTGGNGNNGGGVDVCAGPPRGASAPLSRLNPEELTTVWQTLTGDDALDIALDDDIGRAFTSAGVERIADTAFELAERAVARGDLVPCAGRDDACAAGFIVDFAERAFRRPLTDDERSWLVDDVYGAIADDVDVDGAVVAAIAVVLQAPQLLYIDTAGVGDGDVRPLTGHERATRLALFLTGTAPDDALRAAAARGNLDTPDGVARAAEALLEAPAARHVVREFFAETLELNGAAVLPSLEENPKDADRFPEDNPELRRAMREETLAFVEHAVFDSDDGWRQLFTSTDAYLNGPLADLYGVELDIENQTAFAWTSLPSSQRSGLLTRAAFLSLNAGQRVQSPIRRGVAILRHQLCIEMGDPPPSVSDLPVEGGAVTDEDGDVVHRSVRDDVTERTAGNECMGCHGMINPAGFAFERYDAMGRYQTHDLGVDENGAPFSVAIDSSGELVVSDVAGTVADALEMSNKLAESEDARRCFVERWLARGLRRSVGAAEACSVDDVLARFGEHNDIRRMLVDLAVSDAFLNVSMAPVDDNADGDDSDEGDDDVSGADVVSGITTRIYDGEFSAMPSFATLTPTETFVGPAFDISSRGASDHFAFTFETTLAVSSAGATTFYLSSDDGSRLYVDGVLVVDNDGLHAVAEVEGTVTLSAGPHELYVEYFEAAGREALGVQWQPSGGTRQDIDANLLTTTPAP